MVDGRCMVPNKGVYLGNHYIDGSKKLRNLVGHVTLSIVQNFTKIGDGELRSPGPLHI